MHQVWRSLQWAELPRVIIGREKARIFRPCMRREIFPTGVFPVAETESLVDPNDSHLPDQIKTGIQPFAQCLRDISQTVAGACC